MSQSEIKCAVPNCTEGAAFSFSMPGEAGLQYLCKTNGTCVFKKKGNASCDHPAKNLIIDTKENRIVAMACGVHKAKMDEVVKAHSTNYVVVPLNPVKGGKSGAAASTQQYGLTGVSSQPPPAAVVYGAQMPGMTELQATPVPNLGGQAQSLNPVPTTVGPQLPAQQMAVAMAAVQSGDLKPTGKCQAILASGKHKNEPCGKTAKTGLYCGMHAKKGGSTPSKTASLPSVAGSAKVPTEFGLSGLPQALAAAKRDPVPPIFVTSPDSFKSADSKVPMENMYRVIVGNGVYSQTTRMVIKKGSGVDTEIHPDLDQIIVVLSGHLIVQAAEPISGKLSQYELMAGGIGIIPAGFQHILINSDDDNVVLYSIYTKPNHHLKNENDGPVVNFPSPKTTPPLTVEAASGVPTVDLKSQTSVPSTLPLASGSLTSQLPPTVPTSELIPKPTLPEVPVTAAATSAVTEQH